MPPIQYIQVDRHPLSQILAGTAIVDHVPQFDGTVYVSQYPIAALNAGTALGRVSEINITGTGGLGTVSGKRLTINVDKGVNARSVSPSVGVYQSVVNLDFGAGLTTSFSANTVTVSAAASTPQINLTNNNAGVGIVQVPGTNSAFVLKSLVGAGGTTVQDMGSYIQINSTSGGGGSITLGNTGTGQGIVVSPGTGSSFSLKGLVGVNGITIQDFGNYLQINGSGVGGSYTHPSYTPQTFTPTLVGTTLTVAGFSRDSIGSVDTITPYSFTLPSGGGGIVGISLNGAGTYTNIIFGSGFSVSGNTVTNTGAGHTLGNGALGAGIISVPGFATSHTLKGLLGGGSTTVTDMGSHILITSTSGGGTGSIETRKDNVVVNSTTSIINFTGAGVNVSNLGYVEVNIPGAAGGGIAGISVNGIGTYTNLTIDGAVSIAGNHITVTGGGGGGVGSVTVTSPITNTGTTSNPIIGLQVSGIAAGTYGASNAIPVLTVDVYGRITGITTQPPTGGGGAVTSVTSGNAGVLTVTPTVGNVVITPSGSTTSFTPSFNTGTKTLSLPNTTHSGGILSSQGTTFIDLSSLAGANGVTSLNTLTGAVNITSTNGLVVTPTGSNVQVNLPTGGFGYTLWNDSTNWQSTNKFIVNPNTSQIIGNLDTVGAQVRFVAGTAAQYSTMELTSTYADFGSTINTTRINGGVLNLNTYGAIGATTYMGRGLSNFGVITTVNGNSLDINTAKLSFFDKNPISRPDVITGNLASLQTALANYGLINLI